MLQEVETESESILCEKQLKWFASVLMVQAINAAVQAAQAITQLPEGNTILAAYREWADSFGLKSPSKLLRTMFGGSSQANLRMLMTLENYFKDILTAEALGAADLRCLQGPSNVAVESHVKDLLGVAFHRERKGDVYAEENMRVYDAHGSLLLGNRAWEFIAPNSTPLSPPPYMDLKPDCRL